MSELEETCQRLEDETRKEVRLTLPWAREQPLGGTTHELHSIGWRTGKEGTMEFEGTSLEADKLEQQTRALLYNAHAEGRMIFYTGHMEDLFPAHREEK